ncbi:hypothetical protein G1C97_0494 [Bifidobacterium sp. DSM 109959]|uniref:Uncharacterized protein n=1 Tax=Bifidobacterium olomucense TaxID=2675324 RepID=A0A7Y0HUU6_9BIFI|nr:hypothetical protein [Bifidobacterium sp. DSM 109959]
MARNGAGVTVVNGADGTGMPSATRTDGGNGNGSDGNGANGAITGQGNSATDTAPSKPMIDGDDSVLCMPDRIASTRWVLTFPYPSPVTWLTLRAHEARYVGSAHAMGDGSLRCIVYLETDWMRGDQLDAWFHGPGSRLVTIRRATGRTASIPYVRGAERNGDVTGPWANDPELLQPSWLLRDEPAPPVPIGLAVPADTAKRGPVESGGWLITISAAALTDEPHAAGTTHAGEDVKHWTEPATPTPMPGLSHDGDITTILESIRGVSITRHRFTMLHGDPTYEYHVKTNETRNAKYIRSRLTKGLTTLPGTTLTDALRITPTE